MRVKKTKSVYSQQLSLEFPFFTEPNQAFTPRQIIDQFSRGELSAKSFDPSDSIDDDSFSDDVMVDHTIEFEDEFSALEYMKTTKVKRSKKEEDTLSKPNKKKDDTGSKTDAQVSPDKADEGFGAEKAK